MNLNETVMERLSTDKYQVIQFVADLNKTNNYLIVDKSKNAILIDAGSYNDGNELIEFLQSEDIEIQSVFLTHSHVDHTIGLKYLEQFSKIQYFGSTNCLIELKDCKRNYSKYKEGVESFEIELKGAISCGHGDHFTLLGLNVTTFLTPGHSPGCMCIQIDDLLFTGDFLMADYTTPTNLPNSNKKDFITSSKFVENYVLPKVNYVFSGHGSILNLNNNNVKS